MAEAAEGRFCYSQIFHYLNCGEYPDNFDKNDKRALRKRAALVRFLPSSVACHRLG